MGDRPLKKRLKKSSAEPDGQAGPVNGKGGRGVMGLNPLVGHKVDRLWADVSLNFHALSASTANSLQCMMQAISYQPQRRLQVIVGQAMTWSS